MRIALLLSLVVAAGCTATGPPSREPDTTGLITVVADGTTTILVEERPHEAAGSAKTAVRITSDTRVWRLDGGMARAQPADLRVGITVRVWFDGPVLTSYPGQARASDVAIDPSATAAGLYVLSKGAPEVTVRINGADRERVVCNGGAAIRPRADGTPDLPWQVTIVRRGDGRVVLDERVTALPRWLLVQRETAGISSAPIAGPFVPCP